ncbi:hypothetical protein C1645_828338 [Glomus cerebriforme]|uniref:Uncharacterized protein n=1 Tax=Glomus cerebriforme TaxID=658196 RepID=A0A397SSY3_9GLOM|nr:hypothetical protein C1645_828338 [Glomus cerebriforme]
MSHSPDHLHSIEDNEKLKYTKVIRELVIQKAVKNYHLPEIISAVKEIATEKLDLNECVKELRQKEVTNIKYKIREPLDTYLVDNSRRELDIREAIFFLKNKGYLIERYEIPDLSTFNMIVAYSPYIFAILMDVGTLGPIFFNIKSNAIKIAFSDLKNVSSTNALELYHNELKRITSPKYGLIIALDEKRQTDSEHVAYEFHIKKISFINLNVPVSRLTEAKNAIVNRRQSVSELMERMHDTYWRVEEKGNAEQTGMFIKELKDHLELILNYHKGI